MRGFVFGAAALLASTSLALAADDVMAGYYGNTVVSKSAMGESHTHYKADHTFNGTASGMMGSMDLKGTWKVDDKGQLCRTYESAPPGMPNPLCTPWEAHKAGDTWTMQMGNQSRTISLVSGIH
jgi:hypothetical protein